MAPIKKRNFVICGFDKHIQPMFKVPLFHIFRICFFCDFEHFDSLFLSSIRHKLPSLDALTHLDFVRFFQNSQNIKSGNVLLLSQRPPRAKKNKQNEAAIAIEQSLKDELASPPAK